MPTKIITVSATPPAESTGSDYNKGAPLNAVEFDQNLVNLRTALDRKADISAVIAQVLTGYVSGAGTVSATDTILQAINKLNGNIDARALLAGSASQAFSTAALTSTTGVFSGLITTSAGQIKFPATQNASADANTLDDYEEGTWTPVFSGTSGSIGSTAYSELTGSYTKIGRMVVLRAFVALSSKGSWTGDARITGLPFNAAASMEFVGQIELRNTTITGVYATCEIGRNATSGVYARSINSASTAASIATEDCTDTSVLWFTITYFV